jgi:hypothetical protein
MSRHRPSLQRSHSWGLAGVRTAALLTLILGVVGGLYLADQKAKQDAASALKAREAALVVNAIAWNKQNNQDRALEAAAVAAEKKRLEEQAAADAARKKAEAEASRSNRPSNPVPFGPIPESCNAYSGNRAIGCALVLERGWDMQQMVCLERLWTKESGWNEHSSNNSSGAYGIPQALPGDKMATYGSDWRDNPATQIKWGLSYISGRYGNPCGAWSFFQSHNWY